MSVALGRPLVFRSLLRRTLQRRGRQMGNPPLVNTLSSPGAGLQPICLPRSYPSDVPDFNRSSNIALPDAPASGKRNAPSRVAGAVFSIKRQRRLSLPLPLGQPLPAPRQRQTTTRRIMIPRARINEISCCPATRHYIRSTRQHYTFYRLEDCTLSIFARRVCVYAHIR